jgi:hypothetical protein
VQVFRYSTALERHKLFISGLPFSCTEEELQDICKAHGTVKDLRLVTTRAGKPKVSISSAVRGLSALCGSAALAPVLRKGFLVLGCAPSSPARDMVI